VVDERRGPSQRRQHLVLVVLVAGVILCWILLTPPGAGADEPGHLVRAGALAHGQLDGSDIGSARYEGLDVPGTYRVPEPACYAHHPEVPVSCAPAAPVSDETVTLPSSAGEYPIWGHLPGGVLSRLPGLAPIWWARIGAAAVATALVAGALWLVTPRRPLGAAALLVALTPMAWSVFANVNPSAMAISGGVALWAGLLYSGARPVSSAAWLTAFGWAALALPRRDGLIWACVALVVALGYCGRTAAEWWRSLGGGPRFVVAASTLVAVGWGFTNDSRVSRFVAAAPLIVVAGEVVRWLWRERVTTPRPRLVLLAAGAAIGGVATVVVLTQRPGGWDSDLASHIVGETGYNFIEAIGRLGWLDVPLPAASIALTCAAIGLLGAASLAASAAPASWAAAVLLTATASSWLFELFQGNTSGTYWQGRYSLPLLVGVPLLLGLARVPAIAASRVACCAGGIALVVLNVSAWAAARRWGVGNDGSMMPWDWDTIHSPLPPIVVLAALATLSGGLGVTLWRLAAPSDFGHTSVDRTLIRSSPDPATLD
jgi:Predicted membrane protein (DUF2142)